MSDCNLQCHPFVRVPTDNTATMQQANWQPPLPYLQSTHAQAQRAREAARFDAVLEEIQRQKEIAGELAARQAIANVQQEQAEEAEAETDHLQWSTQPSMTQREKKIPARFCSHQARWISVPGRSRCEWHVYRENAYRNNSRYRCPGCKTIACGLCMKKLKRGDVLYKVH